MGGNSLPQVASLNRRNVIKVKLINHFFWFRIFDIFKPGPIGEMDKMDGGIGVMMDDVVAGILTCLLIQSLSHFSL